MIAKNTLEPRPELESGFPAYKTGTSPYMFTGQVVQDERFELPHHKGSKPSVLPIELILNN